MFIGNIWSVAAPASEIGEEVISRRVCGLILAPFRSANGKAAPLHLGMIVDGGVQSPAQMGACLSDDAKLSLKPFEEGAVRAGNALNAIGLRYQMIEASSAKKTDAVNRWSPDEQLNERGCGASFGGEAR